MIASRLRTVAVVAARSSLAAPLLRRAATAPSVFVSVTRGYTSKRFTPEHEWVAVADGVATVGISDYAQKALGDVVFIELPAVGTTLAKKENLGAVESVKAASDIYAPVSGEVVEINEELKDNPSLVNQSPEESAWIAKIKLSNPAEVDSLLDEAAYATHIAE
ncbi:glycine dehydrogenase [Zopfochytrium polystomum]|nr:glycine dehydrogenase [Zopfochytrium polystomum]